MQINNLKALMNFPGYVTGKIDCTGSEVQVTLRRDGRCALRCPDCGHTMALNRSERARVQDLALGDGPPGVAGGMSGCSDAPRAVGGTTRCIRREWTSGDVPPPGSCTGCVRCADICP